MPNMLVQLSNLGLIGISGQQAKQFLQGQLTCNLDDINDNQSCLGAYCNYQGRMLAAFRLFKNSDNYYLRLPASIIETTLAQLQKYAVFSKVTVQNVSIEFSIIGYTGDDALHHLTPLFGTLTDNPGQVIQQNNLMLLQIPGQKPRFEIIGPAADCHTYWQTLSTTGQIMSEDSWKLEDILLGVTSIYPETVEEFTPHEVNYPQLKGVSFNKGCYTGQEIIARMEYRGQLKKHLYHASVAGAVIPIPGMKIITEEDTVAGILVDAVKDQNQELQLLVILQDNLVEHKKLFIAGLPEYPLAIHSA